MQTQILDQRQIQQKIVRIAHEIIEDLFDIKEIHIVGVVDNGVVLANLLVAEMCKISTQKFNISTIEVDKENPLQTPVNHQPSQNLNGASVVLIDDVINSGKTIQYALNHLLLQPVHQVKTVTLVDRKHRRFPIHADFVGLQLSTTMQERVKVSFEGSWSAYLV
jgi:pyrimidine operon attenuation protein/uracil phosphoribosyltransferase